MLQVLRQLRRTMLFMQHSELSTFDNADMVKSCRDIGMHTSIELQNDTKMSSKMSASTKVQTR